MRELNIEEMEMISGGAEAGCSVTTTTTTNADGSSTSKTTWECHVKS
ncbi:hypothetical protein SRABI118_03026 [Massilia sp. Bi118]|nr:hypothetical protein [Massilia sp. Bi118]CAH0253448.1 hypothetical protein SRABI118_03026 [Massilia sp. Bi118]